MKAKLTAVGAHRLGVKHLAGKEVEFIATRQDECGLSTHEAIAKDGTRLRGRMSIGETGDKTLTGMTI